ncbi:MAG: phenylalanine--tRNA ligase subunit beta [Rickettsiales bacterium]|nr:phenylalanine--tRNA ligase subunit beta [Rickettsiales bacterium]
MKFTLSWLERFLDLTDVKLENIINALTNLGLEVESVSPPSPLLKQFIIGEVLECVKHPNANKLSICCVNDGKNVLNIICGAPNVRVGLKIVLAPVGSIIPSNNIKIEKRKIRDFHSEGMICSSEELGLGEESDGIIELDNNVKIGKKFVEECSWALDTVIDIAVTPNRSDCLGVFGIARDLAAYGIGKLKTLTKTQKRKSFGASPIKTKIADSDACSLLVGRYIKGLNNLKQTPIWLKSTLNLIGENSISPIVDVTNYMNLSFGRPLHAFDADKLEGDIHVRLAKKGEKILTLKEEEIELENQDIVVTDNKKICALAGIMGGDNSKCEEKTKNIFLEAAVFNPVSIAKTGQRTKINSHAKYRFERGIDPDFTVEGVEIATNMITEICGGEISDLAIVGNTSSKKITINFDYNLVTKLSGTVIKQEKIKSILIKLGFEIEDISNDKIKVTVPSWRHDITIPEDLVEEALRIYGYDNIPTTYISSPKTINAVQIPHNNTTAMHVRSTLAALGFDEMITWSFMSSKLAEEFNLLDKSPILSNPISKDLDVLRASLLPNLLSSIHKNNARSFKDLSIFEIGNVFENKKFSQTKMLCALRSGNFSEKNIFQDTREFDFFDLKSDILNLLKTTFNIKPETIDFSESDKLPSWYHPNKAAVISINKKILGYIGEIHPSILKTMKINNPTLGFEVFIEEIPYESEKPYISFSNYQIVSRDFAFIINKDTPASELINAVQSVDSNIIKKIDIFDLFTKSLAEKNKKSIAIRVTLQALDHSLTEKELSDLSTEIIKSVDTKIGGILREQYTKNI